MKNREKKGRLVTLLAKGFLGFTGAVMAVSLLTVWLSNIYYARLSAVPDIDSLREDRNLLGGNYEKVSISRYLGENGAFGVAGTDGTMLYRSAETLDEAYTLEELACMQSYDEESYITYTPLQSMEGEPEHLFMRYVYDSEYNVEEQVMILDRNYQVIGGGFEEEKTFYTPDEVDLMTGEAFPGYNLIWCRLDSERLLLTLSEIQDYDYYNHLAERADRVYLMVIPLYAMVLAAFLMWISRKIKTPLVELNRVIESRAGGNDTRAGNLDGPWEIRQIGQTFDRMTDRLEASEQERRRMDDERQRLLAAISHDLKTPITVISGYTRAVRDGKIPQDQLNTYLERIDSKAAELNEMISTFHEFSKVEHPDYSPHKEKTDVCEFLRSYLAERYDDIQFHGFSLEAAIPDDCRVYSLIDRQQMRRALDNVLYNTLRHGRLGTVLAVRLSQVSRGAGDVPCVRISIADNGSGIPAELRGKIFEPFVRGDEARSGKGSGLGLSISRNIIVSHGGQIRLCEPSDGMFSTEFEILLKIMNG